MIPITFSGCFGWLHPGAGSTGVVLCGAFGHENMNAHRGWRRLAERLAERGFHVVRFDYPGTGDSSGEDSDPDRIAAWQESISAAVDVLRTRTDTDEVILIGLRLGATLALLASQRIERVRAVACLAPVLSGRSYLRELRLLANTWRDANHLPADLQAAGGLDVVGKHLTEDTLRDLSAINLRGLRVSAPDILLMQEIEGPATGDLVELLQGQGCIVSRSDFPGLGDYLQDSLSVRPTEAGFAPLIAWCAQFLPADTPGVAGDPIRPQIETVLRLPDAIERPFDFGPGKALFGVLCTPLSGGGGGGRTVIMLNTGFGRHIGDGRVFVTIARRLAAMGIASLRMDLSGIGDSDGCDGADAEPYAADASADIVAAVDALQEAGHTRPFLIGICSGAHAAFHATLNEPRIRGMILVNIQKFIWKTGASLKVENQRQRRPLGFYVRSIVQPKAWRRLIGGNVALTAIVGALFRRCVSGIFRRLCMILEDATGIPTKSGQIKRWLRMLNSREVRLSLLYTEIDPGLAELAGHVQQNHKGLRSLPYVKVEKLPEADHALLDPTARNQFVEMACRVVMEDCLDD